MSDAKQASWFRVTFRRRVLWRIFALQLVLGTSALLVWGAAWQSPRHDPYEAPDLFSWLLTPEPHRAYQTMPMRPLGERSSLVSRDLCNKPEACGGLKISSDGKATIPDGERIRDVIRLGHSPATGHFLALVRPGELFALAEGTPPAWRRIQFSADPTSRLVSPDTTQPIKRNADIIDLEFSPDGSRLVVIESSESNVTIWDPVSGKLTQEIADTGDIGRVTFSPDGSKIAGVGLAEEAKIWNWPSIQLSRRLGVRGKGTITIKFSPDGAKLVMASDDGARVWDAKTGRLLLTLNGKDLYFAVFSPRGSEIVTGGADGIANIWNASDGRLLGSLPGHDGIVRMGSVAPDGTRVATISKNTGRIWDLATRRLLTTLNGHKDEINSVAFSPDGSQLLTSGADNTTRIWEAASGKLVQTIPQGGVAAYSRDGSRMAIGRKDGTVTIQPARQVPTVSDAAPSGSESWWVVGTRGFAAHGRAGLPWTSIRSASSADLIAVAAIGTQNAVALTASNELVVLNATGAENPGAPRSASQPASRAQTDVRRRNSLVQPAQTRGSDLPPTQQAASDARAVQITAAGENRLRALAFRTAEQGWVVGDGGLILYTANGGKDWSKVHEKQGLALSDIHVETSGVGWAIGKHPDGRRAIVVANKAELASGVDGWRELPHHIGPWYFLLGIPVLLLSGLLLLRTSQPDPAPPQESIEEVATNDAPLRWNDPDARVLKPLARGLSRFLRNVNTRPPLTLAITGRWGSGKSSLMSLLMSDLQSFGGRAVWFNAWHHREEEHLLAALFATIRRAAPPGWWSWPGVAFRARLLWRRSKRPLLNLLYVGLFAGIALVTLHIALPAFRTEELSQMVQGSVTLFGQEVAATWQAALGLALAGSGGVALLGLWLRGKLVALPANPASLVSALAKRASLGDFSDKLAFRHRFGEQFDDVCNALLTRTSPGLVIFIDDLDRCQPEDVLKILEAVNYLVSAGPCIIILGMDRRQVEYCVGLGFEKLVEGLPEDELVYGADESSDKSGKQRAFARHYLEKMINIEVPVPALDDDATNVMLSGAHAARTDESDGPSWLRRGKEVARNTFQIARVGLLAFVAGMFLTWGIERLREPGPATVPTTKTAGPAKSGQTPVAAAPSGPTVPAAQAPAPQNAAFQPARVEIQATPPTQEVPSSRRWLWWAPTILMIGLALLFGVAGVAYRRRQVVQDSPRFALALQAVRPLFATMNATPRAIKRYQNRMRYLAARLRPAGYEPDRIDSVLHWIGGRFGRSIVPPEWFEERPRQAIDEPALILLGAVELFAPRAFSNPAEFFTKLEQAAHADTQSNEENAWLEVRSAFVNQNLPMPTGAEIARYAEFVLSRPRTVAAHPAEVVQLHTVTEPRSA